MHEPDNRAGAGAQRRWENERLRRMHARASALRLPLSHVIPSGADHSHLPPQRDEFSPSQSEVLFLPPLAAAITDLPTKGVHGAPDGTGGGGPRPRKR